MESADRIEAAAARWLARRDAGPLGPEEERAFEAWCAADPRHLGAYVRLEAVYARLDRAGALAGLTEAGEKQQRRSPLRRWVAAALPLAAAAAWAAITLSTPETEQRALATHVGEQFRTALADGSLLELNTATKVAVEIAPERREIHLAAGEALFEVAKDKERPFLVRTALADVRAIGTKFTVRLEEGLEVAVAEGVVAVERGGRRLALVAAGETYRLAPTGDAVRRGGQAEVIERSLAWREGKVAFAGETLAEATQEMNRYNQVKIEIADAAVGQIRFGGYFRATDPEGFAAALEQSLPVKAEREGDVIRLLAQP